MKATAKFYRGYRAYELPVSSVDGAWRPAMEALKSNRFNNHLHAIDHTSSKMGQRFVKYEQKAIKPKRSLNLLEQAFKSADILIQSGNFKFIVVDLSNIEETRLRRVPLTTWFRFARVAEKTQTTVLFLTNYPVGLSSATRQMNMSIQSACWSQSDLDTAQSVPKSMQGKGRPGTSLDQFRTDLMPARKSFFLGSQFGTGIEQRSMDTSVERNTTLTKADTIIPPHARVLDGINCQFEFEQSRKPTQAVRPIFIATSVMK